MTIIDRDGNVVPAQVLANGDGTFTVQAVGVKPGGWYFLKVGPDTSAGSAATGNFALDRPVRDRGRPALHASPPARTSRRARPRSYNFYVGESQLMNFVLSADAGRGTPAPGSAVQMTILDQAGQRRLLADRGGRRHRQRARPCS